MAAKIQEAPVILRRPQVEARTGLCRSSIYQRMAEGTFPARVLIGLRAVGWLEHEVVEWVNDQVRASRKAA